MTLPLIELEEEYEKAQEIEKDKLECEFEIRTLEFNNVTLKIGEKIVLENANLKIKEEK